MYPKRAIAVTLPVHMDDGHTRHSRATACNIISRSDRPKAGTRFAPTLSMGEKNGCACYVDELEMRSGYLPYGGPKARGWQSDENFP